MKVNINGINTSFEKNNGYAKLTRTWEEKDKISMSFDFNQDLFGRFLKLDIMFKEHVFSWGLYYTVWNL